jgi:hypothetical protein
MNRRQTAIGNGCTHGADYGARPVSNENVARDPRYSSTRRVRQRSKNEGSFSAQPARLRLPNPIASALQALLLAMPGRRAAAILHFERNDCAE